MPYNGSGTFAPDPTSFPAVADQPILASKFNAVINDIAEGLSTAVTRDGQSAPTADVPMGGFKLRNLAPGTVGTDAVNLAQADAKYAPKADPTFTGTLTGVQANFSAVSTDSLSAPGGLALYTAGTLRLTLSNTGFGSYSGSAFSVVNSVPILEMHRPGIKAMGWTIDSLGHLRLQESNGAANLSTPRSTTHASGSTWFGDSYPSQGALGTGILGVCQAAAGTAALRLKQSTVEWWMGVVDAGTSLTFGVGALYAPSINSLMEMTLGGFQPALGQDSLVSLGSGSRRWAALYATNGTIQTSDANLKHSVEDSTLGLSFVEKLRPVTYRWKRDDSDPRIHYGFLAQEVEALVPENAALVSRGDVMGLNYSELIGPLVRAVQELSDEVKVLRYRLSTLEGNSAWSR
jgi:hypothetical protein